MRVCAYGLKQHISDGCGNEKDPAIRSQGPPKMCGAP